MFQTLIRFQVLTLTYSGNSCETKSQFKVLVVVYKIFIIGLSDIE